MITSKNNKLLTDLFIQLNRTTRNRHSNFLIKKKSNELYKILKCFYDFNLIKCYFDENLKINVHINYNDYKPVIKEIKNFVHEKKSSYDLIKAGYINKYDLFLVRNITSEYILIKKDILNLNYMNNQIIAGIILNNKGQEVERKHKSSKEARREHLKVVN